MMLAIQRLPVPVIARVQGIATAAGCQLVAMCDLAVASRDASSPSAASTSACSARRRASRCHATSRARRHSRCS
jgi:1,4-dihydroxy-2-naphthoyl-CoA synthase